MKGQVRVGDLRVDRGRVVLWLTSHGDAPRFAREDVWADHSPDLDGVPSFVWGRVTDPTARTPRRRTRLPRWLRRRPDATVARRLHPRVRAAYPGVTGRW
jgi:hypothetical protein